MRGRAQAPAGALSRTVTVTSRIGRRNENSVCSRNYAKRCSKTNFDGTMRGHAMLIEDRVGAHYGEYTYNSPALLTHTTSHS